MPKLDRLGRSVPDARAICDSLAARDVGFRWEALCMTPATRWASAFQHPRNFAEFEVDLLRRRTRERMATARAKGRLEGKTPKLSNAQRTVLLKLHGDSEHSIAELSELFSVSRATVYREIARPDAKKPVTTVR